MATAPIHDLPTGRRDLFGHPRGLTVLATTEMWERFSFLGMQALLLLYMTKYLLQPEHAARVWGLASFRSGVESVTGPLSDLAFAAQTFGLYSGLVYLTPIAGAWLGDRVLGRTRTVTIGCLLMAAGHLTMAVETAFLLALTLLILGAGCLVGNMAAQVGALYAPQDERRTRAFGVYLITLNIGALVAPLIVGTLGEDVSWHLGFGAAGVGMLIGLVTYLWGRRFLPPDRIVARGPKVELSRGEKRRVATILLMLFVPYMLYFAVTNESYSIMFVWADTQVDRTIMGFEMPVTWIGIFDGILTILGVWLGNRILVALQRRKRDPGEVARIGIGFTGVAIAFLFAWAMSLMSMTPLILWIVFFVIQDFSYAAFIEPAMPSIVSRDSPEAVTSMMMAMWRASQGVAYFVAGWLARFYEPLGAPRFWLLCSAIAAFSMVVTLGARRWWIHALGPAEEEIEDLLT